MLPENSFVSKKEAELLHETLVDMKYNNYKFLLEFQKENSTIKRFDFRMNDLKKFENIPEMEYQFKNKRYYILDHPFISNYSKENLNKSEYLFKELDTKIISENRGVFDSNYMVFVEGKLCLYPTIFCLESMTYILFDIDKPILPYEEKQVIANEKDFYRLNAENAAVTVFFIPNANRISGPTQIQDVYKYGGKIPFEYDRYKVTEVNNVDVRRWNYLTFVSTDNTRGMVLCDVVNDNGQFVFDMTRYRRQYGRFLLDSVCIPNIIYEKRIPPRTKCFTLNTLDMPIHPDNIIAFKRDNYGNRVFDHQIKFKLSYPNIYTITNYDFKQELSLFIVFFAPNANEHSHYDNFAKKYIEYKEGILKRATMGVLPEVLENYKEPFISYNAGEFDQLNYTRQIDYKTDALSDVINVNGDLLYRLYNKFDYDKSRVSIFNLSEDFLKRRVRFDDKKEGGTTVFNKSCYVFSLAHAPIFKDKIDMYVLIDGMLILPDYELEKTERKFVYFDCKKIKNDSIMEIVVDTSNIVIKTGVTNSFFSYNEIDFDNTFDGRFYNIVITDFNDNIVDRNRIDIQIINFEGKWQSIDFTKNYMVYVPKLRFKIKDLQLINTNIRFVMTKTFNYDVKKPDGMNSLTSLEIDYHNVDYLKNMFDVYINGRKTPNKYNYTNFGGDPFNKRTIINTMVNRSVNTETVYVRKPKMYRQLIFIKEIPTNGIIDLRDKISIPLYSSNLCFYLNGKKLYDENIEILSSRVLRLRNVDTVYNFEIVEREIMINHYENKTLSYFTDELYDLFKDDIPVENIVNKEEDKFTFLTELDIEHIDYTNKHINEFVLNNDKFIDCETTFELSENKKKCFPHFTENNVCIIGDDGYYNHDNSNIIG